ncbi:MAG TPA: hypothetical protein VHB79_22125 [Polyangiaceae bacterium]|nr:hypothetical protein [Polyangiaceae bacterium]
MGSLVYLRPRSTRGVVQVAPLSADEREYFWAPLLVLWLGSLARVALAVAHHAAFEVEETLALACVILLPLAAIRAWLDARSQSC